MHDAVIIDGVRTPIGRFGGTLKDIPAWKLGAIAIRGVLERTGLSVNAVDEVILGSVLQAADSGYTARKAALAAGLPDTVPAILVNRACSSGLEAINLAVQAIRTGEAEVVIAGGSESMSQAPYLLPNARFDGLRLGNAQLIDSVTLGLSCPVYGYHMGITAENIAARYAITRLEQDELAAMSHARAVAAQREGRFDSQIVSVQTLDDRRQRMEMTEDEHPRPDTSIETLSRLATVFKEGGTVTAGNSAGINDAAAAVIVMSEERSKAEGLEPRLRWVSRGLAGVAPDYMGIGPSPATRRALERARMKLPDVDLIELNEAFAAQVLYVARDLDMDMGITNVNGGGISLGHPIGATGAIMVIKLMEELMRRDGQFGLATLCVGGGQGVATIFERLR